MSMLATGLPVADSPLPDFLEPYSGLRYLHKPVDLIMLNTDEHILTNAAVRMVSQGGSDEESPMTDFTTLYKKYAPDVFRFALYLSGDRGQAEDITSETFVRAWTSRERIEVATVKGYLFTIARNLFLQGLRRTSRHVQLDRELPDPQASPYLQAEQKEEFLAVLRGLQELPEIDRVALADEGAGWYGLRRNFTGTRNFSFFRKSQDPQGAASARGDPTCAASG